VAFLIINNAFLSIASLSFLNQFPQHKVRDMLSRGRWTTTTTTTTTTTSSCAATSTFSNDTPYFNRWVLREQFSCNQRPRVLIYNWGTEDVRTNFVGSIYWLSCYAHQHGFDIVFDSSKEGLTGVKTDTTSTWYANENMWGWVPGIQRYLFSGKWDYVIYVGIDVLVNGANIGFPIWFYDQGHDITIMDQPGDGLYAITGYNENAVLFRPTEFVRRFLAELFEFRKDFYLQGDNGPYMEMMLRILSREATAEGRAGYLDQCLPTLKLEMSLAEATGFHDWFEARNAKYVTCFFKALDELAGIYGYRKSKHIGFSPLYYGNATGFYRYEHLPDKLTPAANCFHLLRRDLDFHPWQNCLFFHYNGDKMGQFHQIRGGRCDDPTFDWPTWKYNPNRSVDFFADPSDNVVDIYNHY